MTINSWFTVISRHMYGEVLTLECNTCGEVFDIDLVNETNLVPSDSISSLVPKCPSCGQEGEI